MAPAVAAGLVAGGSSLANNIVSGLFNKSESEESYSRQLELLKYQNAYNSPEQQMQRYKDAGLNPNLIYGSGSASSGNMSNIPMYKPVQYDFKDSIGDGLSNYYQTKQLENNLANGDIQRQLMIANTQKSLQNAITDASRQANIDAMTAKTAVDRNNAQELGKYISDVQEANLKSIQKNIDFLDKRSEEIDNQISYRNEQKKGFSLQRENWRSDLKTKAKDRMLKDLTGKEKQNRLGYAKYGLDDSNMISTFGKMLIKNVADPIQSIYDNYIK